jgi:hypothetical protein
MVFLDKLRARDSRAQDGGNPETIVEPNVPVSDGGPVAPADLAAVSDVASPEVAGPEVAASWDLQPALDQGTRNWEGGVPDVDTDTVIAVDIDAIEPNDGKGMDAVIVGPDSGVEDVAIDSAAPDSSDVVDALADSGPIPPVADPDLVLWYKFDESTGSTAADSAEWNGVARNATLATYGVGGNVGFSSTSHSGTHALGLTSSTNTTSPGGGYASLMCGRGQRVPGGELGSPRLHGRARLRRGDAGGQSWGQHGCRCHR